MDLKNNTKSQDPKPTPEADLSHFCESSAGHLSVQTTSPFRLKMMDSELVASQKMKGKNDRSTSVSTKKLPNDACSSTTSRLLVNQIIRDNNLDGVCLNVEELHTEKNLHQFGKKCNYSQNFNNYNVQFKQLPTTFNSESSSVELGFFPREESVTPAAAKVRTPDCASVSNSTYSSNNQNNHAEKSTYCRPILSVNQEFVKKTIEKNERLQTLVKKLIIAREKEKETEAWNNYINELKNNFENNACEPLSTMHSNRRYFEYIDNYYTKTEFNESSTCSQLLQDFFEEHNVQNLRANANNCIPAKSEQSVYFENQADCYPMSSQGRLMMLNKERKYNQYARDWQYRPPNRSYNGRTIIVDREYKRKRKEQTEPPIPFQKYKTETKEAEEITCNVCKDCVGCKECKSIKSFGIQTSSELLLNRNKDSKSQQSSVRSSFHEQYEKVSQNVDRLKKKIQDSAKDMPGPLASIEDKIDKLITSLNSFIEEVKSKISVKQCYNCQSISINPNKNVNMSRSETFGLIKAERLVCGLLPSSYTNSLPIPILNDLDNTKYDISHGTSIEKILHEEIDSSKKAKEDIENMLTGDVLHPCVVHIELDIPTKERSTEVTDSLSKTILNRERSKTQNLEKVIPEETGNMTIAVNTDPLGLLALLRVSTETLKQLLSYMPHIPYPYLPMIQSSNPPLQRDFVCKICGAAFGRPSQLTEHIQSHSLGKTRDCCVCRHILDMQSHRMPGLFCCRYCGQRFTRAYCCELHQDTCAKRFGLKHEGRPSLMLLR